MNPDDLRAPSPHGPTPTAAKIWSEPRDRLRSAAASDPDELASTSGTEAANLLDLADKLDELLVGAIVDGAELRDICQAANAVARLRGTGGQFLSLVARLRPRPSEV